jgi:TM2 domain-containing membrane protein YozV
MADINFDCPHCNQNLDAFPDMAGETIECPACGEAIAIPSPTPKTPSKAKGKKVVIKKRTASSSSTKTSRSRPKPTPAAPTPQADTAQAGTSEKSRLVALLLCMFLGYLGIHRFYVGKIGTGILMIITAGGLGIWVLIDLIMIVVGSFRDKAGRKVYNW